MSFELSHFTTWYCNSDRRINDLYGMPGKISYIYKLYLSNLTHISKDGSGFTTLYVEKLLICAPKECFIYVCINQVASNSICPLTRFTKAKAHVLLSTMQSYWNTNCVASHTLWLPVTIPCFLQIILFKPMLPAHLYDGLVFIGGECCYLCNPANIALLPVV